jgi:hypothetical protein
MRYNIGVIIIPIFLLFNWSFGQAGKVEFRKGENGKTVVEMATSVPDAKLNAVQNIKKPVPLTVKNGYSVPIYVDMAPVNVDSIKAQDEKEYQAEKAQGKVVGKSTKIGVVQKLPEEIKMSKTDPKQGQITTLSDGTRLWMSKVRAQQAFGVRLHFTAISLPPGASIVIYNTDKEKEVQGPYDAAFLKGRTDFWSNTIFGSTVSIECSIPGGVKEETVAFDLPEIAYIYEKLGILAAGNCHNDVTCWSGWTTEASACIGLGDVAGPNVIWCTGSRLNSASSIPYLLTADHCGITTGNDQDIEVYWLYQTTICNGAADIADAPRNIGATWLAGRDVGTYNDFCFLRLEGTPPVGTAALGWTTAIPAINSNVTCIHHPSGDFKRITFGNAQDHTDIHFVRANWHTNPIAPEKRGCTERGSSGSPLFNANRLVVGQLYGGPSYCGAPDASLWDYYGRFNYTYPIIQHWLVDGIAFYNNAGANKRMVNDRAGTTFLDAGVINGPLSGLRFLNNSTGAAVSDAGELITPNLQQNQGSWLDQPSNLSGGIVLRNSDNQAIMHVASTGAVKIRNYALTDIAY